MAAGLDAAHNAIGWPHLAGATYIGMSWIVDVFGFLAMIGIIVLAYIRYIQKPDRLNDTKSADGWMILLIFVILLTGYFIEGLRIAAQIQLSPDHGTNPLRKNCFTFRLVVCLPLFRYEFG